jgi:catechol 2,3-dioxygenase-like lactoylglutathione lyase family enzyme
LNFFEQAFGIKIKFLHDSGDYGELDTGETTLAFASQRLGETNIDKALLCAHESKQPLGFEVALITDDLAVSHRHAIECGGLEILAPTKKPWGQTVSYVQSPEGILIELCTAIS